MQELFNFYKNKKVLITGHTGFKGSWMCSMLEMFDADVLGYSLEPPTSPSLFDISVDSTKIKSIKGDIRNLDSLKNVFEQFRPEIVIHMAAQPLVRESYQNPVYTYETNVLGTVNVLECIRLNDCVKSFINVTTDKVYRNKEWIWGYREDEELNGYDPYSNSKSCSELVTSSYFNSFFKDRDIAISTCRAGNVIGGGDFAVDRIIPDCFRAASSKQSIIVRNPYSTRPYQHVLEPVFAYLYIAKAQYENKNLAGNYNIGPDDSDCKTTGELVSLFCDKWNDLRNEDISWIDKWDGGPHEANFLKLDCSKVKKTFGLKPKWNINVTMDKIVEWYSAYNDNSDVVAIQHKQIEEYLSCR